MDNSTELIEGVVLQPDKWTPEWAARYISDAWRNAVESIIETGRRLIKAKDRVEHGDWMKTVELLPFSQSAANKLMQVARHPDLANSEHVTNLPPSWGTLAVLAQLPPGEIPKRIEAREITPELDRATAQQWAAVYQQAKQEMLNLYSKATDGLTMALSSAQAFESAGVTLPASYLPIDQFIERAERLAAIAREWRNT